MRRSLVPALMALGASAGCGALLGIDDVAFQGVAEAEGGLADASSSEAAPADGTAPDAAAACGCPKAVVDVHPIAASQPNADLVRVTSEYVYWVAGENGSFDIRRCKLEGSPGPEVVYTQQGEITSLAVSAGFILFGDGGEVHALREDGKAHNCSNGSFVAAGVPILVAGNAGKSLDLTVRGGEAWWIDETGPDIESDTLPPDCEQSLSTRSQDEPGLAHLQLDSTSYYWNGQSAIRSCALGPPGCRNTPGTVIVANPGPVRGLALDSTYVYWSTSSDVRRAPLVGTSDGGAPIASFADPRALVVAGGSLFVGEHGNGGSVVRVEPADGGTSVVASGVPGPTSIAMDAVHVYFTSKDTGRVMCALR